MSEAQISRSPLIERAGVPSFRLPPARYCVGILALAAAYFGAAKLGQTLRYTASVSAIWPPAGLGIAALYLFGLRWWPGVFVGELLVNGELFLGHANGPAGSLAGQWAGNMVEVVVGAWLLRRLIGPNAALDRATQVVGMILAVGTATAISATVGTVSMLVGGVIDRSEVATFWRTWLLGDAAGALVVLPLLLTWLRDPGAAWHRMRTAEGILLIGSVVVVTSVAVSGARLLYLIFPSLIWAAFRFGPPGVTLSTAITAGLTIGITADRVGVFFKQPIDDRVLTTQLYILVAGLTPLFLSAVISERERSVAQLVDAKRRESERALEERRRIARDLHDSVSQSLFSSVLHTRAAQKVLEDEKGDVSERLGPELSTIGELTKRAQDEMRRFIFEWGPEGVGEGLVPALTRHVSSLESDTGLRIDVDGPPGRLPLARTTEAQLYAIAREALANVVRHAAASCVRIRIEVEVDGITVEIQDDGRGFDPASTRAGHYGLDSMRSRAEEIHAALSVSSTVGRGTVIRVRLPTAKGHPDAT